MAVEVSESGWTTYLNTSCGSLFYSESMVQNNDISDNNISLGDYQALNVPNEESICVQDASTVSDASSGPQQPVNNAAHFYNLEEKLPKRFAPSQLENCRKFKKIRHNSLHTGAFRSPDLEDTATSSPLEKDRVLVEADNDVSKRFKVLEALIPRLKELAGRASEEEMLKVIISYVQALELKVEMFGKYARDIHDSSAGGSLTMVANHEFNLQEANKIP